MKIALTKKRLLVGGGIVLILVAAGVAGVITSQILYPPKPSAPKTVSGLPTPIDDTQNLRLKGDSKEADKKADELLNQPGTSDATKSMLYLQKDHVSMEAKDYKAAVGFYTQAANFGPSSETYTILGEANFAAGDKAAAKTAYQKAITLLDPKSPFTEASKLDLQQRIEIIDGKQPQ